MSEGQKVPDEIVDDLLGEAMLAKLDKSKVRGKKLTITVAEYSRERPSTSVRTTSRTWYVALLFSGARKEKVFLS